jgi:hypothetical protein|tara:strand:+ start:4683 stop:5270 length:588 start_codon:yes stop_codon:yes gene_type:complete
MAKLLVTHAGNILPPEREVWAQAMSNEIDHLPDSKSALRWAIGCVYTSYIERMTNMNMGNLRVSRAVLTVEMLMCFGILCMFFFGKLFQIGNFMPFNRDLFSMLSFTSLVIGPIGLIFAFRLIVLKRTDLGKAMVAALIIPVTWTFIVNGIVMWILAERSGISWDATIILVILPALGVAHLIYMSNPEGKMKMTA